MKKESISFTKDDKRSNSIFYNSKYLIVIFIAVNKADLISEVADPKKEQSQKKLHVKSSSKSPNL